MFRAMGRIIANINKKQRHTSLTVELAKELKHMEWELDNFWEQWSEIVNGRLWHVKGN